MIVIDDDRARIFFGTRVQPAMKSNRNRGHRCRPGPAATDCRMARCIAAWPDIKREPSREITLRRRAAAEDQLWARRISRCVSPAWPTSYAHPRRVSPFPSCPC